ncbi:MULTISPECIES: Asp-tRNA(Asn)/Glu-tRNA(Gln) amidotransferase subunit GatC [Brevibacillus]|jgi:aspartyl-tRNA(Asn)/glutamyl-tRNA(Gln) amidotransferase subunit C|uniref:Aspartyl/glutamyl-tRNA(Asn/Gln) amidotransferase subunit C n=2 Tax=Brevibacillus TaxID=55080 RepID=A0A1I3RCN4_9BACL|nr:MULTISPECIES: Asp-tRNA(Asn)/Glu-tRNA(Gln) amidotransferase subunit GatC [Brevibacillus]MED1794640.1 Asp-tRNA(Asn)/Glu-tRNA(Gln) amidotransferase subunit GatC [Brevibacillus nitrificans]MED1950106.1 Asp-tRNA(Asn)/Glu-tRNA(Gln) amidotransferase subunit GatC [Brevibacillus centrosporus]MED4909116.1 Asp-tRNA(Asn)/Glu-tRNA(Gln) amidotransferase subunit GatC [Brevibacillus centrosporus]RNB83255.1 Asp-tRNA(Asn)/Glu-tRNA(Gln) amidotransferase subunit GatC [Brevibacillus nitrificans]SFJ43111.1 aspar
MSAITRKEVEHVANLARLQLTEDEAERYTKDLNAILEFAAKLNELDTSNVAPTSHATDVKNVMREDVNRPSLPREEVLKNAPDHEEGQFKVPAVFE